jgi:hypothetical protein
VRRCGPAARRPCNDQPATPVFAFQTRSATRARSTCSSIQPPGVATLRSSCSAERGDWPVHPRPAMARRFEGRQPGGRAPHPRLGRCLARAPVEATRRPLRRQAPKRAARRDTKTARLRRSSLRGQRPFICRLIHSRSPNTDAIEPQTRTHGRHGASDPALQSLPEPKGCRRVPGQAARFSSQTRNGPDRRRIRPCGRARSRRRHQRKPRAATHLSSPRRRCGERARQSGPTSDLQELLQLLALQAEIDAIGAAGHPRRVRRLMTGKRSWLSTAAACS